MKKLTNLIGWVFLIIGAIIAWGWLDNNMKLIGFFSYGVYIKFTTAAWFILVGISFLFFEKYPRVSFYFGMLITLWTLTAFILEYIYPYPALNSFFKWLSENHALLQVPAPNTCICFILIGSIFLFHQYTRNTFFLMLNLLNSFIISSLSLVALIGYTLQITTAYGWSNFTQMSFLSAAGIFITGLLFIYDYYSALSKEKKLVYAPVGSFIFISIFSGLLWVAVYQFEEIKIKSVLSDHLDQNAENVTNSLNRVQSAFLRFKARMENTSYISDTFWKNDAESYVKNIQGVKTVALLKNNKIKIFAKSDTESDANAKKNIFECIAISDKGVVNYKIMPNTANICFTAKINNNNKFDFITFIYNLNSFIKPLENHDISNWYKIGIVYNKNYITQLKNSKPLSMSNWEIKTPLSFNKMDLNLVGFPSEEFIKELGSNIPFYLLFFSLIFAVIWAILLLYIMKEKTQEYQIRNLNRKLQQILDSSHMAIIATDVNGVITHFNRGAERVLEYSADEMVGIRTPVIFYDHHELDRKATLLSKKLGKPITPDFHVVTEELNSVSNSEHEWTYISKSGKRLPVILSLTALRDEEDKIYGYLGISLDISERKQVEHVKNEFISMVSHELRTPLTSIHGSIVLLVDEILGTQTKESLELLNIALNNTDRLIRLINDILDLEKIESGKMKFTYGVYKVNELIQEAVAANQGYAAKFSVNLISGLLPTDVKLRVDHDRMLQVLTNLISNAVKFSPKFDAVLIKAKKEGPHITITITDKGKGIPLEFQKVIFNKFAQADSSAIRKQQGTGLGLNISKLIVETMGGAISFKTKENIGTSFSVRFSSDTNEDALETYSIEQQTKPAILHIEDDNDLFRVLNTILKNDYIVDQARTVEEAKGMLAKKSYKLVILDLKLQDDFSYELLPYLYNLHISVIVLTSYELPAEYEKYVKHVLTKSKISNETIINTINSAIKD